MAMAISAPIPIPLTPRDEEQQLRFAIMRSLEENYSPQSSMFDLSHTPENLTPSRAPNPIATSNPSDVATSSASRTSFTPYRRSKTMPNCVSTLQQGSPNTPTLTLNAVRRARSVDYSPPRPTYSTDCCEVKHALILQNKEYLDNLMNAESNVTSPLQTAVRLNHIDCLEEIVSGLPELIDKGGENRETALFRAAATGNIRAARRLLAAGARVDAAKVTLDTPLQAAIENEHGDMALLLLKNGADPNQALNRRWTSIHECVYRGNPGILKYLLNHGGNPNIRDGFGISPVFSSAACGRNECLDMLLRAGGDPNLCSSSKTASPLYEACKETHLDCVLTLLKYGADPHLPNCDGLYPIHIACLKGSLEIVEELLKVTDRTLVENCGMSPVHSAAQEDEIEILETLIENGYDVNIKLTKDKITYRDRRQTALFFAVFNDSEEATEILLEAGAQTELDYVKPLLVAVSHGQYTLVDLLISHGADTNACFAKEGALFPAAAAFAMKDPRMFKKILRSGCDVTRCFNCTIGDDNHSRYDEQVQKQSFCHFISQERNVAWAGCTILGLLDFVSNVSLCSRMRRTLQETEEWETIANTVENPRSLSQLCRLSIREKVNYSEDRITQLPLPRSMLSFLNHDDF